MPPIPFEIEPGSGCPGGLQVSGKPFGLCLTCTRLGGRELQPAVRLVEGEARCVNFHPLSVGGTAEGVHPAEVGNPDGGAAL
jgi:hypothetical protein